MIAFSKPKRSSPKNGNTQNRHTVLPEEPHLPVGPHLGQESEYLPASSPHEGHSLNSGRSDIREKTEPQITRGKPETYTVKS